MDSSLTFSCVGTRRLSAGLGFAVMNLKERFSGKDSGATHSRASVTSGSDFKLVSFTTGQSAQKHMLQRILSPECEHDQVLPGFRPVRASSPYRCDYSNPPESEAISFKGVHRLSVTHVIVRLHPVNPWSRANTIACVRDQTPSLSNKFEA
jgi:hypothetical protein